MTMGFPATVASPGVTVEWAGEHRAALDALLLRHGAVLVTGAGVRSPADLAAIRESLGRTAARSTDLFARREHYGDGVYSWPEWAADRDMCLHHEHGYGVRFPGLLLMGNLAAPDRGGQILLGDTRAVFDHLPGDLAARFAGEGWTLLRTFRPYLGLSWSTAFGTDDQEILKQRCARDIVGCSWTDDGAVQTGQRRSAIVNHPLTGERCWFNDLAFFSQWSVAPAERKVLLSEFGPRGMPFNTFAGNGESLTEEDYEAIISAYAKVTVGVVWSPGDLLLVDNILTAHGREPYSGTWEVAVALADAVELDRCAPSVPPSTLER
jgi:alpha-ketoglutarate-dependent taurine dioxygenase